MELIVSGGSGIVIFKYKIDPAANPDGSALAPFENYISAQLYGATSGQIYYFLHPAMTDLITEVYQLIQMFLHKTYLWNIKTITMKENLGLKYLRVSMLVR